MNCSGILRFHLLSFIIIASATCCLFPRLLYAETYYVRNGAWASEWSESTDINKPASYIQANNNAQPGDTIVFLNSGGEYQGSFIIWPTNNGTESQPITYKGLDNTRVVLKSTTWSANLGGKSYINVENFAFDNGSQGSSWVAMRTAGANPPKTTHHIKISKCSFTSTRHYWTGLYISGNAHHISIVNNTFTGGIGSQSGHDDLLYVVTTKPEESIHHVLIEGNTFLGGAHVALEFQANTGTIEQCIVRNNIIRNPNHVPFNLYTGSRNNLIEGNVIYDGGSICSIDSCSENTYGSDKDRTSARWIHSNIQLGGSQNIIRFNQSYNGANGISMGKDSIDNRIYHNVFTKNVKGLYINTSFPVYNNVFKNNIISENDLPGWYEGASNTARHRPFFVSLTAEQTDNFWINNGIYDSEKIRYGAGDDVLGLVTAAELQTSLPKLFQGNIFVDPLFHNAAAHDYRLKPNSTYRNAGAFLTRTTNTGQSSTTMTVEDARYFMDGWGLIEGDQIQLDGQTETTRLVQVDYNANTITLTTPLTWSVNQGVSLPYAGTRPDIGAFNSTAPSAPSRLRMKQ